MAKNQFDMKKEWEKTKGQLIKFSKEALEVAKKGEEELVKFSKKSKLHIDSTAINLRKEKLYYLIGKEYVHSISAGKESSKVKKLLADLKAAEKEQKSLKIKISKSK